LRLAGRRSSLHGHDKVEPSRCASHAGRAVIAALQGLGPVGAEMARRARAAGVMLIWRAQTRNAYRVVVRRGRVEGTSVGSSAGHGIQVVTPEGRTALASRDDLREEEALALFDRVVRTAGQAAALRLATGSLPALEPTRGRAVPRTDGFERIRLDEVGRRLAELEGEIVGRVPGSQLSTSYHAEVDAWRVVRSDGTDVLFAMPRCTLGAHATHGGSGPRHGVSASLFSPSPDLPWDEPRVGRFLERAERAARLARDLPDAPGQGPGSFPLLIDYALAKGLAHEAFGHASEADGYRSSVLARDGRFRAGDVVGADHVSIVDEPLEHDHAWQPYSANGVVRERATIVRNGKLTDGLSDVWSAGPGGVRLTGAGRAESFRHAPLPRMSNIRIEVADPLPAAGSFEDYGPERVRDLLESAGVLRRHPRVVHLSGYSGGQVNPTTGDFVFNCQAIYVLSRDGVELRKPAIFSGSMFAALHAVREAFGPLMLDALGYCGKWGQSVPSSGGSHYFLLLEPDPGVRLGGR
jgi:TldD protein